MTSFSKQDALNLIREWADREGLSWEVEKSFNETCSFLEEKGLPIDYRREAFYALWDWDIA